MAVTWGAAGASSAGTISCTPSYPTGISSTTSELFCIAAGRSSTADTVISGPAGWTSLGQLEGGTGTYGADTGTRRIAFFRKDTVTGTETGTQTFSFAAGNAQSTISALIFRVVKTSNYTVSASFASGADTTNDTSYSVTSSSSLTWSSDDFLLIGTAQNLDTGTQTSKTLTATGVTFGSITNQFVTAVTNGNDHRRILDTSIVSSASTTAAVTYGYTVSAAASGVTAFVRLRESSVDVNVQPTGLAIASAQQAMTPAPQSALIGIAITSDRGLVEPERQRGLAMAAAQQTLTAIGLTVALAGHQIDAGRGEVSANNNGTVALAGLQTDAQQTTPSVGWGQLPTGLAITSAQQQALPITLRPTDITSPTLTLTGGIVTAVGDGVTVAMSGEESTFFYGNLFAARALGSLASTSAYGSTSPITTKLLVGEGMTAAYGTASPEQSADDVYATASAGSVVQSLSVLLVGRESIADHGEFTPTNDGTRALTGIGFTAAQEAFGFSRSFQLEGLQSTAAQHPFGAPGWADLTSLAVTATAGLLSISPDRDAALTSQSITADRGVMFASPLAFVAGETMNIIAQEIGPRGATLEGLDILARQGVLAPPVEPSTEAGSRKRHRPRYIVRHRGQDLEFEDMDEALAYAAQAKAEEKALPRKERKSVRVIKPDDDNEDVLLWLV